MEDHHAVHHFYVNASRYETERPTLTAAEIQQIAGIDPGSDLFLEVEGDHPDRLIADVEAVHLKDDEDTRHFYSEQAKPKQVTIIVNGTPHKWPKDEISYAEVVTLEVPDYLNHPEITYSVKYKRGRGEKPEGVLSPGASVKVKEGMIFSVSETGQS